MKLLSRSFSKDGEGHVRMVAEECESGSLLCVCIRTGVTEMNQQ